MTLKQKAELLAQVLHWHSDSPEGAFIIEALIDARDTTYANEDRLWYDERWSETLLRYQRTRRLTSDKLNELYCRAVLAGLHNNIGEA